MKIGLVAEVAQCNHRIPEWAKGLSKIGHQVFLITPNYSKSQLQFLGLVEDYEFTWIQSKTFRSKYKRYSNRNFHLNRVFQKILRIYRSKVHSDGYERWSKSLVQTLKTVHSKYSLDLIVVSVSPFSIIKPVSELANLERIPWLVDYRDLWSQNHTSKNVSEASLSFEKKLLEQSAGLITVSNELSDNLKEIYNGKIQIISNGFSDVKNYIPRSKSGPIRIIYAGSIYLNYQNLDLILDALLDFNKINLRATLSIYGPTSNHLKRILSRKSHQLPKWLKLINEIAKEEVLKVESEADLLLVLNWENPKSYGILGTKIYSYLGAGRPIILTGGYRTNQVVEIVEHSGMGKWLNSKIEIIKFLENYESGKIDFQQNLRYIKKFSFDEISKSLDGFLQICAEKEL